MGQKTSVSLKQIADVCKKNNIPRISKSTGELLSLLILLTDPKKILEIGTGGGYSTVYLAQKLKPPYKIDTIENNKGVVGIAKRNIQKTAYGKYINVVNEDAQDWIKQKKQIYDFIFVDGKKSEYEKYLKICSLKLKKDGIIVFDDTLFWKKVKRKAKYEGLKGIYALLKEKKLKSYFLKFNQKLIKNKLYETFIIPVGNGLTIAIKRE